MTDILFFNQIPDNAVDAVGGKALSLARMTAAGLAVPPGYCLTTEAFRRQRGRSLQDDPALVEQIDSAYRKLGGPVAVRSSMTAEDGAVSSFAGQQETILGVEGEPALHRAIESCWASLDGERAVAYRRQHRVGEEGLAMAVVIQQLVLAEVAGVLFSHDPCDPAGRYMVVEASWGLGETVVSGRVTPDRFYLDRQSGQVIDRHIGDKTIQRTPHGEEPVPPERQMVACLDETQLAQLAALGRQVEGLYGEPRDVEWAFAEGRFWLLQARPITASAATEGGTVERQQVRREEIDRLASMAAPGGTVWSKFNLAEVLPAPTPMSWSVVRRFMSGGGGFGLMYRDLGYDPDPSLEEAGIFDLVCGRPYCNLSREPRLHYRKVPFAHSFAALKANPRRALYPTPTINPMGFRWWFWLGLPVVLPWLTIKIMNGAVRRERLARTFAGTFRNEIAPAFKKECDEAARLDLAKLDDAAVVDYFARWTKRTLIDFARDSLKPTALAALSRGNLEQKLALVLGPDRARELALDLVMGVKPDEAADLGGAVRALANGELSRAEFLERFGHRGPEEMELSQPRWSEVPAALEQPAGGHVPSAGPVRTVTERLEAESKLNAEQRALLMEEIGLVHTYLALRETAKHYLMYGYALMRRALVELDRRYRLEGGIFFLTAEELPRLLKGEDFAAVIAERRRRRSLLLGLEAPPVLFSDDLESIGRPAPVLEGDTLKGVPLSSGVAEAPALVLDRPHAPMTPSEGYILVCPSTDPAWVPLFVHARGLVMETGGVLSHGAIVAREFGLPGVAGVPGVMRTIRTGRRVRVDGRLGVVTLL